MSLSSLLWSLAFAGLCLFCAYRYPTIMQKFRDCRSVLLRWYRRCSAARQTDKEWQRIVAYLASGLPQSWALRDPFIWLATHGRPQSASTKPLLDLVVAVGNGVDQIHASFRRCIELSVALRAVPDFLDLRPEYAVQFLQRAAQAIDAAIFELPLEQRNAWEWKSTLPKYVEQLRAVLAKNPVCPDISDLSGIALRCVQITRVAPPPAEITMGKPSKLALTGYLIINDQWAFIASSYVITAAGDDIDGFVWLRLNELRGPRDFYEEFMQNPLSAANAVLWLIPLEQPINVEFVLQLSRIVICGCTTGWTAANLRGADSVTLKGKPEEVPLPAAVKLALDQLLKSMRSGQCSPEQLATLREHFRSPK